MVKRLLWAPLGALALASCQSQASEYVFEVDLPPVGDATIDALVGSWANDCRSALGTRPDFLVSVTTDADGQIVLAATRRDPLRRFAPLQADGTLGPDPMHEDLKQRYASLGEALQAIPDLVETIRPNTMAIEKTCAYLTVDQTMKFSIVSEVHRRLTGTGLRFVNLLATEAAS